MSTLTLTMNHDNPEDIPPSNPPPTIEDEEPSLEELRGEVRRLVLIVVTLLVVLAMLAMLARPLLHTGPRRQPTPTPTPAFFRTA